LKGTAIVHRPYSVVALFNVYSSADALIAEASELARDRGVGLEVIAIVSPLRAWLITIGRGMAPVPVLPVSQAAEEDAVVRGVARLVGAVPPDVSVRWRIFNGSGRRALREAAGQAPASSLGDLAPEPVGNVSLVASETPAPAKGPRRTLSFSRYWRN
jgi:hypothetical protein